MSLFTMQLLDVISPGSVRRPRVRLDTVQSKIEVIKPKNVVDTLANHHGCCENMADSCCANGSGCSHAADTVSASTNGLIDVVGNGGGGSSTLIWAVVAVLFALALCFYFVSLYRKSLATR